MQLEKTLQSYQVMDGENYRFSSGLYELLSGQRGEGIKWSNPCMRESFDFKPAKEFNLGPGIARRIDINLPIIERFRYDESHGVPHINYEEILDIEGKRKKFLFKHLKIGLED